MERTPAPAKWVHLTRTPVNTQEPLPAAAAATRAVEHGQLHHRSLVGETKTKTKTNTLMHCRVLGEHSHRRTA